jgi:hypothetical protein
LINGPHLSLHLPWIFLILEQWNQKETNTCTWQLHVLSRAAFQSASVAFAKEKVTKRLSMDFPSLLEKDPACAASYLELEQKTEQTQPAVYAKKWQSRLNWPASREVAYYLWQASEMSFTAGDVDEAQRIWSLLISKTYKAYPEAAYASIRLDPKRTELESLWGQ